MSFSAALDAVLGLAHFALEALATLLTPLAGGLAAPLAIVALTVAIRLAISPLSWLQARSARRGAALAPQLAVLRDKHRDDPVLLATETLALQRAHGAGPGAALLPALAQAPFLLLMYQLVQPGTGAPTGVLGGQLFGVPLTAHLAGGMPADAALAGATMPLTAHLSGLPVFAVLLAVALLLAWWSARRARRTMTGPGPLPRILAALPFLTVAMVAWLPLAGGLYLVTSTAWTALEQAIWRRPAAPVDR